MNDETIGHLLRDLAISPLGLGEDDDFRISLAGAQEKTALLFWNNKWFKPFGSTATTHILKPQIGRLPNGIDLSRSVENEYLCLKLMQAFGLPSAKAEIVDFGDHRTLVVERFDRMWTKDQRLLRLPQEDLCQALSIPPTLKYESDGGPGILTILNVLRGSDTPEVDRELFMKSQVVFWLLGATDGHAKNFSLFLGPGGFRLTPLYDVISTQPNVDRGDLQKNKMKLAMAVGNNRHYKVQSILPRHFCQTVDKADFESTVMIKIISDLVDNVPSAIASVIASLPKNFPEDLLISIERGIRHRLEILAL